MSALKCEGPGGHQHFHLMILSGHDSVIWKVQVLMRSSELYYADRSQYRD